VAKGHADLDLTEEAATHSGRKTRLETGARQKVSEEVKVTELTEEHIEAARGDCVSDEEDAADPDYVQPAHDSGDESNAGDDAVNPR
jgi:hypothetical protein